MLKYIYPIIKDLAISDKESNITENGTCDMCLDDTAVSDDAYKSFMGRDSHIARFLDGRVNLCKKCSFTLLNAGNIAPYNIYKNSGVNRVIVFSDSDTFEFINNYDDIFTKKAGMFFFFKGGNKLSLEFEKLVYTPMPQKSVFLNVFDGSKVWIDVIRKDDEKIRWYLKSGYDVK